MECDAFQPYTEEGGDSGSGNIWMFHASVLWHFWIAPQWRF